MRAFRVIIFVIAAFTTVPAKGAKEQTPGLELKVLSFNIRYGTAADGPNHWSKRSELVYQVIRQADADFVGLQEALDFQIDQIINNVTGYDYVGVGRHGGRRGEYSAILYRSKRFKVDESDTFWLSNKPEKPSRHWGNSVTRICTWARFIEKKTCQAVYLYNTHLDHQSQPSREKSVRLIIDRIANRLYAEPFILTGDFNAGESNPAIRFLKGKPIRIGKKKDKENTNSTNPLPLVDTFRVLHTKEKKVGTFNGFKGNADGPKIDYIFAEPETKVQAAEIVRTHKDNRYPSDHFPVTAKMCIYTRPKTK